MQKENLPEENIYNRKFSAAQHGIPAGTDTSAAPFEKSKLCLVTDLQNCIKAKQSKAYAGKVKITNL